MGIRTVPHLPYSSDLAPFYFWLFPKLRGRRYETIEEIKEAVTKVIDTLTQEDFHGALQKLLERYECIAGGGDYFEEDQSFMCVLSIKVPIRKKSGNLFNDPRTMSAGIRIRRLYSLKRDKTLLTKWWLRYNIKLNLLVRLLFWRSVKCRVLFLCHYSQDHANLEGEYLLGSPLRNRSIFLSFISFISIL